MMKTRSSFVCQQCGYSQSQWAGKCPNCQSWNSLVETIEKIQKVTNLPAGRQVFKLQDIKINEKDRLKTGEAELDGVLGGGLVPGMVALVAGEPGIGKSTLLTQVALRVGSDPVRGGGKDPILYVCGEESPGQVALRIKRLGTINQKSDGLLLFESTDADEIVAKIGEVKPKLVVVDSIQTLTTSDL